MAWLYRSTNVLANTVTVLLSIAAALDAIAIGSSIMSVRLMQSIANGRQPPDDVLIANDMREGVIALGQIGILIVTAVFFCIWLVRSGRNARALGAEGMKISPGWAAGWFFIPIANLFKPYQAVKEIYQASSPDWDPTSPEDWKGSSTTIVGLWWAMWIITNICGQLSTRLAVRAQTPEELISAELADIASAGFSLLAAICAISVVRTIHTKQVQRIERIGEVVDANAV